MRNKIIDPPVLKLPFASASELHKFDIFSYLINPLLFLELFTTPGGIGLSPKYRLSNVKDSFVVSQRASSVGSSLWTESAIYR